MSLFPFHTPLFLLHECFMFSSAFAVVSSLACHTGWWVSPVLKELDQASVNKPDPSGSVHYLCVADLFFSPQAIDKHIVSFISWLTGKGT